MSTPIKSAINFLLPLARVGWRNFDRSLFMLAGNPFVARDLVSPLDLGVNMILWRALLFLAVR